METVNCVKGISDDNNEQYTLLNIANIIKNIKYGYIQITIHDGKVVQIDKTEKIRLKEQKKVNTKRKQ